MGQTTVVAAESFGRRDAVAAGLSRTSPSSHEPEALTLAQELAHPFTLGVVRSLWAAMLLSLRRE